MIDLNATQAAIRAGYSVKNAASIRAQLLKKTHVSFSREHGTQLERRYHTGPSDAGVGLLTEFLHTTTRAKISHRFRVDKHLILTPKFTPNSFYKRLQHFTSKAEKA